jgi:hypothetical protein
MSGGHFGYQQHVINDIAESIQSLIDANDDTEEDEYGGRRGWGYSPEVIAKLQEGVLMLRKAYAYAHRIDWLVSGDDGEATFLEKLEQQLRE